ncbi:anthrone oxygenase family protein [Streptomyces sp. CWNU-52B]|uniref:anthrone oxygenase family protein n=1 Tax=unclassified Streptomyces TaxID=2593676 RepID=UPI0039BF64E0
MRGERTATALRFATLAFAGVFAGFLVAVLVLEVSLRRFDGSVYTQVRQVELLRLDDLASATLLPALLSTAVLAATAVKARDRTRWAFWLTSTAFALLLTVLATTLAVSLPINADQLHWNVQAPPADWASVRDRWQIAHAVRTAAAVVAFGLLSAAALSGRRPHTPTPDMDRAMAPESTEPTVMRGNA